MRAIEAFADIPAEMIWRGNALNQIARFKDLAMRFGVTLEIAGQHRSKSIDLPVVALTFPDGRFVMRDNFYDLNVLAQLRAPSSLTLHDFFAGIQEPRDWDWYLSEIARARAYSWREWSDAQMDDETTGWVTANGHVWKKSFEEKERWRRRLIDPAWWSREWSGGELTWDGAFGPGVELFVQQTPFAEGINLSGEPRKYVPGSSAFVIALDSLEAVTVLLKRFGATDRGSEK